MRHKYLAATAAALIGLSSVALGWSSSSSKAPYGSHLLDAPPPRSTRATPYATLLLRLRAAANAVEVGASEPAGIWLTLATLELHHADHIDRDSRIVLQHSALRIATALERRRPSDKPVSLLAAHARQLVKRLALPRDTLSVLSRAPRLGAEDWLGPESQWIERTTTFCGDRELFHERAFRGLLAFHPVRSGERRALISQLVAVDQAGNPHITPIVETIEIRVGMEDDAPVAVLELDLASLGNGHAALSAPAYDRVHESTFVQRDGAGGFRCTKCHANNKAWGAADVLDLGEATSLREARRTNLLRYTSRRLDSLEL